MTKPSKKRLKIEIKIAETAHFFNDADAVLFRYLVREAIWKNRNLGK